MDTTFNYQIPNNGTETFNLFRALPIEIRIKIWHLALSTHRIIPIKYHSSQSPHLISMITPHPLLHTNHKSRTCALETLHRYSWPPSSSSQIILNPKIDYFFFIDSTTFEIAFGSKSRDAKQAADGNNVLARKLQHIAVPLVSWEKFVREQGEESVIRALSNFPNLEEIVLVAGYTSEVVLKSCDLEFVMPKDVPSSPVMLELTMKRFQPWRAFAHLFRIEMMEDAVGMYFEELRRNGLVGGNEGRSVMDLLDEMPALKFKIREIRSAPKT